MKKIAFAVFALLAAGLAMAQVQFPQTLPANTVWGRLGISSGPGQAIPFSVLVGNLLLNVTGDCSITPAGVSTCTKTNGVAFATPGSATTDTTNAANISSGTLPLARLSNIANSNLAQMAANTVKANISNATANASDTAVSALGLPTPNLAARFGSMDVWQRGAGGSASIAVGASTTAYTVDGCYLATGANEASIVAAVAGIATGSNKAAAVTRNSGQTGTTSIVFGCPFDTDEIALFAGQFVTLSFTASTGANWSPASGNLVYELFCGTGAVKKQTTGYTGQTTPINTTQAIGAGSSAARFQSTSAAIVPANCTQAEIQFNWTPVGTAGAADTVTIDDVKLEIVPNSASLATPYLPLDFNAQLSKAQRHFAKTFAYGTVPAQNAGILDTLGFNNTPAVFAWPFPVQQRATPTITTFNPSAANANCRNISGAGDTAVTVDPATTLSADRVLIVCAAGGVAGNIWGIHATADAGI